MWRSPHAQPRTLSVCLSRYSAHPPGAMATAGGRGQQRCSLCMDQSPRWSACLPGVRAGGGRNLHRHIKVICQRPRRSASPLGLPAAACFHGLHICLAVMDQRHGCPASRSVAQAAAHGGNGPRYCMAMMGRWHGRPACTPGVHVCGDCGQQHCMVVARHWCRWPAGPPDAQAGHLVDSGAAWLVSMAGGIGNYRHSPPKNLGSLLGLQNAEAMTPKFA